MIVNRCPDVCFFGRILVKFMMPIERFKDCSQLNFAKLLKFFTYSIMLCQKFSQLFQNMFYNIFPFVVNLIYLRANSLKIQV